MPKKITVKLIETAEYSREYTEEEFLAKFGTLDPEEVDYDLYEEDLVPEFLDGVYDRKIRWVTE